MNYLVPQNPQPNNNEVISTRGKVTRIPRQEESKTHWNPEWDTEAFWERHCDSGSVEEEERWEKREEEQSRKYQEREKKRFKQMVRRTISKVAVVFGGLYALQIFGYGLQCQGNLEFHTKKLDEIDVYLNAYKIAYNKEVPFKEQVQRDVYSLSLQYEKDDLFPHTHPYQALLDTKTRLDAQLPSNKSSWTTNQKEGYQWVVYSLEQFDKENAEYIAHFHRDIHNCLTQPEFLLNPITRHNTTAHPKEPHQNTH